MKPILIVLLLLLTANLYAQDRTTGLIIPANIDAIYGKRVKASQKSTNEPLPAILDYMEFTTPVRDQAQCAACWAFASVSTVEAHFKRLTGQTISISTQWLVESSLVSNGCQGGWIDFGAFIPAGGDRCGIGGGVLDQDRIYDPAHAVLACDRYIRTIAVANYVIGGWQGANNPPDVQGVKRLLFEQGPVAAGIYAPGYEFQHLKTWDIQTGINNTPDHVITIMGYDDTTDPPCFIIKNSWGDRWGRNGYGRIAQGSRMCGWGATAPILADPAFLRPIPSPTPTPIAIGIPVSETTYLPIPEQQTPKMEVEISFDRTQVGVMLLVCFTLFLCSTRKKEVK